MAAQAPWQERLKRAWRTVWKTDNPRVVAMRDIGIAIVGVLLVLTLIWTYTGQSFPGQAPLVVVESGSMMHGPDGPCLEGHRGCSTFDTPVFSRVGTIDPGDLVLVKRIDSLDDVETAFGFGNRGGYGSHGDVIVYKRTTSGDSTPIIHRAMLMVQAVPEGCRPNSDQGGCTYIIPETCSPGFEAYVRPGTAENWRDYCQGSSEPFTLKLERDGVFLDIQEYPCPESRMCPAFYSGILTKGDNNRFHDQNSAYGGSSALGGGITCCPVKLDQIIGKARGEIPWFGLIKLMLAGNERYGCDASDAACSDPTQANQWTIFRATAPWDIWAGLFLAVGILFLAPMLTDTFLTRRRDRKQQEAAEKRFEEEALKPDSPSSAEPPRDDDDFDKEDPDQARDEPGDSGADERDRPPT